MTATEPSYIPLRDPLPAILVVIPEANPSDPLRGMWFGFRDVRTCR